MAKGEPHRSTQRVIEILQYVSENPNDGLTLTDLAGMLNAPKSSLFPIVHTLCQMGMLSLDKAGSRYSIGFKAYEIGNVYVRRGGINAEIEAEMHAIVEQCGETCLFAQLVEGDVFYLLKADSTEAVRTVVSPGQRLPAYATGIGKALLSGKSREEILALYPNGLQALTAHTIIDFDRLYYQLGEIKRNGLAFECEESTPYIRCVAVPIRKDGIVRAAMSIAVPVFRYNPQKEALVIRLLREAQIKIESLLAAGPWNGF